ncbi:heterokaryon incompatibility protein [Macroventuria anomochaeta]|uniref:Heterokaryon incompatibility protein n=1 Tax=Macroventuria anomochaeta TaxID=301207 RepID=A0ACB6S336_9PLEO|nr:heterokaryon incompatibility protein [Macroventuria anomochaeta]KAF2627803.1 heterokaryon incompatibility protein [Macroventuria anomochaeta]
MAQQPPEFTTTYEYSPLEPRHIRLLECARCDAFEDDTPGFTYRIVHVEVPENDPAPAFEAISYTWGDPLKTSVLPIHGTAGHIALTANLTRGLPHISQQSATRRLWIDQLCINQADNAEKSAQVGLMSEIYSKARRIIVWLGPEDDSSRACMEWCNALNGLLTVVPNAERMQVDKKNYHDAYRFLAIKESFMNGSWGPRFTTAITDFWSRMYFTRGWVVQEYLLARELIILTGNIWFSVQDLEDMFCVPPNTENSGSYRQLIQLKRWKYNGEEPLGFFRKMSTCAQEFTTKVPADRLYSMTGLLEDIKFVPNYDETTKQNFTRFAATVAQKFGSLDFVGLCAATVDLKIPDTLEEFKHFPSWVPSWSEYPLFTPYRLVVGGTNTAMNDILWNAAAGRKHIQEQPLIYTTLYQLHVRGKIVDWIDVISSRTMIGKERDHFNTDATYLDGLIETLKEDLSCCSAWEPVDLVHFLNGATHNGREIESYNSAQKILKPETRNTTIQPVNEHGANDRLALILMIGRGRRMATTENGKLALVPFIESRAKSETRHGSPIVILHGCSVPLVLECVDKTRNEYRVIGEAYVEKYMLGGAVTWDETEADEFILV